MDDEALQQKAMAFHQLWQLRLPVFTLAAQIRPEQIVFNAEVGLDVKQLLILVSSCCVFKALGRFE